VLNRICGSAEAQENFPVCQQMREGFSQSGRRKRGLILTFAFANFVGACSLLFFLFSFTGRLCL
jgi:hypothetical protein